jgi:hypothetical protein
MSREAFEKWFYSAPHRKKYDDTSPAYLAAHEAWQAALQSGEPVALERVEAHLEIVHDEVSVVIEPDPEGSLVYYDNVVRAMQSAPQPVVPEAEALARMFHETYESLAEVAGYETRLETRSFNLESPNGRLMVLVCAEIRKALLSAGKETV